MYKATSTIFLMLFLMPVVLAQKSEPQTISEEQWTQIIQQIDSGVRSPQGRGASDLIFTTGFNKPKFNAHIKPTNTDAEDQFGYRVVLSGDTLAVSAIYEDSNATGLNGDQANNASMDSGAVYVFVKENGMWFQEAYIKASNADAEDMFGHSMALSGNTLVVSSVRESSAATGINGDQADNTKPNAGAVYVFVRNHGIWSQQAYIKASNTDAQVYFGESVDLSNDTLVVGASGEGDNFANLAGSGAVYVFQRNDGVWSQQAYIKASNAGSGDAFGYAVALSGNTLAVSAIAENSNATGINGDQLDNSLLLAGAVYVFENNNGLWLQQAYIKASNPNMYDLFGYRLDVFGNTLVVGAIAEAGGSTGINGDQLDNSASSAGALYLFERENGIWSQQGYIKASNTDAGDAFGSSIVLESNTLVVGANRESSPVRGINADQFDNSAADAGAVYVFTKTSGQWQQQLYMKASNTDAGDAFGTSVALSGNMLVVGAVQESSATVGVNGSQSDNSADAAGAVYEFTLN